MKYMDYYPRYINSLAPIADKKTQVKDHISTLKSNISITNPYKTKLADNNQIYQSQYKPINR